MIAGIARRQQAAGGATARKLRTRFNIEMMIEIGYCAGIENYSRYLSGRRPGEPPPTLFDYLPADALLVVDESHVTIPQLGGMYRGDRSRKENLVDYGFRLPSALDNRPLKFEEFLRLAPQAVFVSATPGPYELEQSGSGRRAGGAAHGPGRSGSGDPERKRPRSMIYFPRSTRAFGSTNGCW